MACCSLDRTIHRGDSETLTFSAVIPPGVNFVAPEAVYYVAEPEDIGTALYATSAIMSLVDGAWIATVPLSMVDTMLIPAGRHRHFVRATEGVQRHVVVHGDLSVKSAPETVGLGESIFAVSADAAVVLAARNEAEGYATLAQQAAAASAASAASVTAQTIPFAPVEAAPFTRPVASKLRDWLSVRDIDGWGVSPAGNRAAINTALALAEAQGVGIVRLPRGAFDTTDDIIMTSGVSLVSDGSSTRLQNTGSSTYHVRAEGALGAMVALLSNAARGDTGLEVASTAGWAPGDYLLLGNTIEYAAAVSPNYFSGEMTQIASIVDATHVALTGKIYGSWQPSGAYAVADGANVRRVSPIIRPTIRGIELASDHASPTRGVQFEYALGGHVEMAVRDYGNAAITMRGCIDSRVVNAEIRNLRDDIPNGRAGYGVVAAGPCMGLIVKDGTFTRLRHAFTTLGGITGMPHGVLVSGNLAYDTSSTAYDTHAAGEDIEIAGNAAYRCAGSGISFRSRNTRIRGNTISGALSHGIAGAERMLANVDVENNRIKDVGAHGIICDPSCVNLRIVGNEIDGAYACGIRAFNAGAIDSGGLIIAGNIIRSIGLGAPSSSGIVTQGAVVSTGALIAKNHISSGVGAPAYAISTVALSGSAVTSNSASGTFSTAVFNLGSNVSLDNRRVDGSVDQVQLDPTGAIVRAVGPSANVDLLMIPKGTGVLRHGAEIASTNPAAFSATHMRRERLADGTNIYVPFSKSPWGAA